MLLLYVPIWVLGLEILKQHDRQLSVYRISYCMCRLGWACAQVSVLCVYVYMCVYVEQCNSGEDYMPRTQTDNGEKGSMD